MLDDVMLADDPHLLASNPSSAGIGTLQLLHRECREAVRAIRSCRRAMIDHCTKDTPDRIAEAAVTASYNNSYQKYKMLDEMRQWVFDKLIQEGGDGGH